MLGDNEVFKIILVPDINVPTYLLSWKNCTITHSINQLISYTPY